MVHFEIFDYASDGPTNIVLKVNAIQSVVEHPRMGKYTTQEQSWAGYSRMVMRLECC